MKLTNMRKEINILFSTDTNYVTPLLVCLTSIFENNSGTVNVYIFHSPITQEQKNALLGFNRNIFLIEIDEINIVNIAEISVDNAILFLMLNFLS